VQDPESGGGARAEIEGLVERAGSQDLDIRPDAVEVLVGLAGAIGRWNKVMNLVSRKDANRLVSYHFCDSASLLPVLRPRGAMSLLDVGGSNGLPGMVLAALSPHIRTLVCDSKSKRRPFLEEACALFGGRVDFEIGRVDSNDFRSGHAEMFDVIVARAVTRLKLLLKWCLPLLKPGGLTIAYKGSRCEEEVGQVRQLVIKRRMDFIALVGSPWGNWCNQLRIFAIAKKGTVREGAAWAGS
jgi:16S rRNA (guanine(527)-N(7))-methyltransferase RsmG